MQNANKSIPTTIVSEQTNFHQGPLLLLLSDAVNTKVCTAQKTQTWPSNKVTRKYDTNNAMCCSNLLVVVARNCNGTTETE